MQPCEIEDAEFKAEYAKIMQELRDMDEQSAYSEKFETMVEHICDFDFEYIAIDCRYLERLDRGKIDKYALTIGAELVSMGGYVGCRSPIYHIAPHPVAKYGEIMFKCNKVANVFKLVNHVMEYQHCAMFDWITLYEVKTRIEGKYNIVVLKFDSESG